MNQIFKFCQSVLKYLGQEFGISYFGTNVILFDIIGPAVFLIFFYRIVNRKTKHPFLLGFLAVSSYVICFLHSAFFVSTLPPWYFFPVMVLFVLIMIVKCKKVTNIE
jgi:predicted branched-subunit amino acid permease